jgi:hypothetical protein
MSNAHKIANAKHENGGRYTTRSYSKHGLSKAANAYKKYYNRLGKRGDARLAFKDEASG